jgi:hypothetical protein
MNIVNINNALSKINVEYKIIQQHINAAINQEVKLKKEYLAMPLKTIIYNTNIIIEELKK